MADETAPAPRLGVAPLSGITASTEEYLGAAGRAGFDFVGIRLSPVTAADTVYTPTGAEFLRLKSLVRDSGLTVLDIEVFSVTAATTREQWMPLLEMAAELGATLFNVVGDDPELGRFAETVARLNADARWHSITPVIEPIAYRPMNSYERAVEIARVAGCAVELDALHVVRTGADVALVAENRELFPILQLCDAPAVVPAWGEDRPAAAHPGDDDMIIESRLNRLLPGRGAAPLAALLGAVAPGTPVSLEIPNLELQAVFDVDDYFALLYREGLAFCTAVEETSQ